MISLFDHLARPLLRVLDPEGAHGLTIRALRYASARPAAPDDPQLAIKLFGLTFPNPIGLAAGFDKNAEVPHALLRLGFGFVEVGTITPQPTAQRQSKRRSGAKACPPPGTGPFVVSDVVTPAVCRSDGSDASHSTR